MKKYVDSQRKKNLIKNEKTKKKSENDLINVRMNQKRTKKEKNIYKKIVESFRDNDS